MLRGTKKWVVRKIQNGSDKSIHCPTDRRCVRPIAFEAANDGGRALENRDMQQEHSPAFVPPQNRGTWLVVGLIFLGLFAAVTGIWFQWGQTRRCLSFYGPATARQISSAPRVELWLLKPGSGVGRLVAAERRDISAASGLVHLRRGLVEDDNFSWPDRLSNGSESVAPHRPLPAEAWNVALVFFTTEKQGAESVEPTILAIDFDERGSLTVVGRPGRIGLGRIGRGLEKWIGVTKTGVGL